MEVWDVYDKNRVITGNTMIRGNKIKEGDYHLVVHVIIFNSNGEMLIQQRQSTKKEWPDMWDITVGGSAIAGECSYEAAEREVFEEIGHKLFLKDMRPSVTVNFEFGFDDYYIINEDVDIGSLKLQSEEVQNVQWADCERILSMIRDNLFISYHKGFIEFLFSMKNYMGAIRK